MDGVDSQNSLFRIRNEKGEDYVLEQIIYLVKWINDAFAKNLSDSMIYEVSLDILQSNHSLKIEDITLFASEFRKGNIIKIPYQLELQHIYEGLKVYKQKRLDAIEKRHEDIKQNGYMPRQPELSEAQKLGGMIKHISKNIE